MKNSNKKRVFLFGGTSNCLFQISHAICLSKRGYEITLFYVPKEISFLWKIFGFSTHENWLEMNSLAKNFKMKYEKINFFDAVNVLKTYVLKKTFKDINFDKTLDSYTKFSNKYIIGYYQSKNHQELLVLNSLAESIKDILDIPKKVFKRNVVHFRGGDFHESSYIRKEELKKILDTYEDVIFTTNDRAKLIEYCLDLNRNLKINSSKSGLKDFKFMSSASRLFISFSTFSFWAGLICNSNGGEVIFPYEKKQLKIFKKNQELIDLILELFK